MRFRRNYFLPKPHSQTHTGGSDLLFAIEQAIATEIQYMIYNTLNSNYLYFAGYLKIKSAYIQWQIME